MRTLFFAVDVKGELLGTSFDHEGLILECFKRGFISIYIFYITGSNIIWETIDTAGRLHLRDDHKFKIEEKYLHFWKRPFECIDHKYVRVKRQFEDSYFVFCQICGEEITNIFEKI